MDGHSGNSPSYEFGVDIGGTFTDVVCRSADGTVRMAKIPTTRGNPSLAVLAALETARNDWGVDLARITRFVHGTTVATNAVLERKGARIGLITTLKASRTCWRSAGRCGTRCTTWCCIPRRRCSSRPGRFRKEVTERSDANGETSPHSMRRQSVTAAAKRCGPGCPGDRGVSAVFVPQSGARAARPRHDRSGDAPG